jgi:hypothetical protein
MNMDLTKQKKRGEHAQSAVLMFLQRHPLIQKFGSTDNNAMSIWPCFQISSFALRSSRLLEVKTEISQ